MNIILEVIRDHIEYRQQIFKLAKSDLMKTYRGATLGWSWAIIKPAVTVFIYWFALALGLRGGRDVGDYPYFLWLIAGLVPWFAMRDSITAGSNSIRKYKHLVTKIKYPVSTIPTFVTLSNFITHLILMAIMIAIFLICGYGIDIHILQLPVFVLFSFTFFSLWGLFAGMVSAMSSDFKNLVSTVVQALFWLSGILYPVSIIKNHVVREILAWNPVTYLVTGYRNTFVYRTWFWEDLHELRNFAIITLIMFIVAMWAYKKLRKEIPDVL